MTTQTHFSRTDLAKRWGVTTRTIDRLREANKLPWLDISAGRGAKPLVRFRIEDLEAFEQITRQAPLTEQPSDSTTRSETQHG
jgi:hypothetical protein